MMKKRDRVESRLSMKIPASYHLGNRWKLKIQTGTEARVNGKMGREGRRRKTDPDKEVEKQGKGKRAQGAKLKRKKEREK